MGSVRDDASFGGGSPTRTINPLGARGALVTRVYGIISYYETDLAAANPEGRDSDWRGLDIFQNTGYE